MNNTDTLPRTGRPCTRRAAATLLAAVAALGAGASFGAGPAPGFGLRIVRPTAAGPTVHAFDAATLAALGTAQTTTHVPWDPKVHVWEGVPLKRLMGAVQVAGRPLRVKALNDYAAVIPWADLEQYDPLLAWRRDGQAIPVREKGPLLVIYPFAAHPELRRAEYIDRSVWHVNEIVVE